MILNNKLNTYVYSDTVPRGRIYDRNKKLLVDNTAIKSIVYKKENNITQEQEIQLAYQISKIIDLDYKKLTTRNLKEFYIIKNKEQTDNKITKDEYKNLENRKITEEEIYERKLKRITKEELNEFNLSDKKAAYLYYLMNKGYYYDEKQIKTRITNKEYSYISENKNKLHGFNTKLQWERKYLYGDTLKNILGSISDSNGIPQEELKNYLMLGYSRDDRVGISGIEKQYENVLRGTKDKYKVMEDNSLKLVEKGTKGNDIVLSIDIDLQLEIEKMLEKEVIKAKKEANTDLYSGSFIIIQNPSTGEILSLAGEQLYKKGNVQKTYNYEEGNMLSTITPGSVVKGASMIVGYNNKAIDIGTTFYDNCIHLYNLPSKCSWRTLGRVNDIKALQYSSNVYQFLTAMRVGGFNYSPGKKLVIKKDAFDKYRNVYYQFGLGSTTGIDYPQEEIGYKGTNTSGDLLINFAIGQYDTYTPLQLSQYVTTVANEGKRIRPHFLKVIIKNNSKEDLYKEQTIKINEVNTQKKYINRIRTGFRKVMAGGTGIGYINEKYKPAGKTGTSESFIDVDKDGIIDSETISNNFVGYAPYNKPIMSITTASPNIQNPKRGKYKSDVNYRITKKASDIFFKFYDIKGNRIKKV